VEKVFVPKWYHLLFYPDWLRRLHQRPRKFLSGLVGPGMTAADIGCGLGFCSLELARLVGDEGRVLAVDFQDEMLEFARKKAAKAGLLERIEFVKCAQNDLAITEKVDFVLTMWVAHEVPDRERFFRQIRDILRPEGRYLLAEPVFHVRKSKFRTICEQAQAAELYKMSEPKVAASFAALFGRPR
jgi:ubiquinone/menaquinone biosynthesis C-methylase UbiE